MGLILEYEVTDKKINWKLTIFGTVFLIFRFIFMQAFIESDGRFHPEVMHTSYIISIFVALSMILSFRVKLLNIISVGILPSFVFTIFMHDIPYLFTPEPPNVFFDLLWWNFATIHIPLIFLAIYMIFTRKETMSRVGLIIMIIILMGWGYTLDDLENGVLNAGDYILVANILLVVWGTFFCFVIMKGVDIRTNDPFIAPILEIKGFKWVRKENNKKLKIKNIEEKS